MLQVYGELDAASEEVLRTESLAGRVEVHPRINNDAIVGHMKGAAALLLIIGPYHRAALASKIFDYALTGRPILGYGPKDAEAARLVERAGLGHWVDTGDQAALIVALRQAEAGALRRNLHEEALRPFSAEEMTRKMAALLDAAVC